MASSQQEGFDDITPSSSGNVSVILARRGYYKEALQKAHVTRVVNPSSDIPPIRLWPPDPG